MELDSIILKWIKNKKGLQQGIRQSKETVPAQPILFKKTISISYFSLNKGLYILVFSIMFWGFGWVDFLFIANRYVVLLKPYYNKNRSKITEFDTFMHYFRVFEM